MNRVILNMKTAYHLSLFVFVVVFSSNSYADVETLMQDMLGVYTNVTPGNVIDTQRRGGYTLGSVNVRNRVMRPNLVNFTPPSFRGGCGGLDFYGGSFSFINSSQLTTMLQSIASNALTYAFTLALEGVCPTCMQKIEVLRKWQNKINGFLQDSCTAATKLVDATDLDDWAELRVEQARQRDVRAGARDDPWQAIDEVVSELTSDTDVGDITNVNVVWKAMQNSQTTAWFGPVGDDDLRQVLMSVTGTITKTDVDADGNPCTNKEADQEYCVRQFPSSLTVRDFIEPQPGVDVDIYSCGLDVVSCLHPELVAAAGFSGIKELVRVILFGPAPIYTGGLVFKLYDGTVELTETEQRFIEGAPLPVYRMLMDVNQNLGSMITIAEQIQQTMASQLARVMIFEMIMSIQKTIKTSKGQIQLTDKMEKALESRVSELRDRKEIDLDELQQMSLLINLTSNMAKQARGNETAGLPTQTPLTSGNKR